MPPYFIFGPYFNVHSNVGQNASNVTACPYGIQWIWIVLNDCIRTPREQASAYLGIASLITWMLYGFPQVLKNIKNINGLAGVSILLLLQWTGGDLTNLIGAVLTNQLKLQIYLAIYFVLVDVVLLIQYSIFILRRRKKRNEELRAAADPTPQLILCLMGFVLLSGGLYNQKTSLLSKEVAHSQNYYTLEGRMSRSLLSARTEEKGSSKQINHLEMDDGLRDAESLFWHDKVSLVGYSIGIISSLFYLGSRLAQIYKNRRSQSTQGLAVLTFVLAVIGNLTYGAQILVHDVSTEFLLEKTPWLVGSLGVIGLDCVLLFQFHYYRLKHRDMPDLSRALLDKEYVINAGEEDTDDYIY